MPHPSGEDTFYVHELDTHPDFRRQGIGQKLMQEVVKYAKQKGFYEAWVATETDNIPANNLYKKLSPSEVEASVTYSYKL